MYSTRFRAYILYLISAYITPVTLSKMNKEHQDLCWHNCGSRGTLLHLLWDCPAVKSLWLDAISYMSSLFKVKFPICPTTCLLGKRPVNTPGITVDRLWTLGCLTITILILMNWKVCKPGCFTRESWLGECLDLLNMERAACLLKDFDQNLDDHWVIVYNSLMN